MRGPARIASIIAVLLVVSGFGVIYVAYDGSATLDSLAAQFPYLVSGGVAGLGLVMAGATLLWVQTQRRLIAERSQQMAEINTGMARVATLLQEAVTAGELRAAEAKIAKKKR